MKVCMLTGLSALQQVISFRNAGGMGTQVPLLIKKLRERGVDACMDDTAHCDILHLHNPMPQLLFSVRKAKKQHIPVVIHARHLPELVIGGFKGGRFIYPIFEYYSRYLYNQADAIVCATPYVQRWMEHHNIRARLYVIPNGVDCSIFKPSKDMRDDFRTEHDLEDAFVVLSVGLMIPRKGIYDFEKMARRLKDMTFVWIGSTEKGMERVSLEPTANFLNIPYVPFKAIPRAYNGADVFFFPTHAESYGNVLMEAAACKRPLVIRDIEIYKRWFEHGKNCLKGSNVDDFAHALQTLATDDSLRKYIANEAYETARRHDITHTVDALIAMYEDLTNR